MAKKTQPQQVYKTETQLKEEARVKLASESEAAAKIHKTDFQKKRENFWYHYKWHTIGGLFIAFLLVFFIRDIFFRTKPDATIIIVSGGFISSEAIEGLAAGLEAFAPDLNEDGKIMISTDYISLPMFYSEDTQDTAQMPDLTGGNQDMGNAMKLMTVLAAGTDPIYLLDETSYEYIAAMGQGENPDPDDNIFEELSVPADSLNVDRALASEFDGMKFYLRTSCSDEIYYEQCKQFFQMISDNS